MTSRPRGRRSLAGGSYRDEGPAARPRETSTRASGNFAQERLAVTFEPQEIANPARRFVATVDRETKVSAALLSTMLSPSTAKTSSDFENAYRCVARGEILDDAGQQAKSAGSVDLRIADCALRSARRRQVMPAAELAAIERSRPCSECVMYFAIPERRERLGDRVLERRMRRSRSRAPAPKARRLRIRSYPSMRATSSTRSAAIDRSRAPQRGRDRERRGPSCRDAQPSAVR